MSRTTSNLASLFLAATCGSCGGAARVHPVEAHPHDESKSAPAHAQGGCHPRSASLDLSTLSMPADARCLVNDEHGLIDQVVVRTGPRQHITLRVTDAAVALTPTENGPVHVRVDGPLRFEGWARIERYGFRALSPVVPDVLIAGPEARLAAPRLQGDRMRGTFEIERMRIPDLDVACSLLATAHETQTPATFSLQPPLLRTVEGQLALRKEPRTAAAVLQLEGVAALTRGESAAEFVHVKTAFSDGTYATGWTPSSSVEPIPNGEEPVEGGRGIALCGNGCGGGADPEVIVGEADIAANAPVHASPGGAVWAAVPNALHVEVTRRGSEPWFLLQRVPGLTEDVGCETLEHAFVEARHVRGFTSR